MTMMRNKIQIGRRGAAILLWKGETAASVVSSSSGCHRRQLHIQTGLLKSSQAGGAVAGINRGILKQQQWKFALAISSSSHFSTTTTDSNNNINENDNLKLYQYAICPFCNITKAVLHYNKIPYEAIEVNPLTKSELNSLSKDWYLTIIFGKRI